MNNTLLDNRQIRVFISSTFRDMQDERDYLMKRTFPTLQRLAAERDVTLTELDLRWGITAEEAESGKVVEICLREIENCIPFFIGIIGDRYGWVPQKDDIGGNVTERFGRVGEYLQQGLSVTEMEMQFGVLDRAEDMHAFFYFKDSNGSDQDNPVMIRHLKNAIRESRYPSSTYTSADDLGAQVEAAFTDLLNKLFPETQMSQLEKERSSQRTFMNQLCLHYIRPAEAFRDLDEWFKGSNNQQLVVTGASGLGKSALMANWVKEKLLEGDTGYNIVYHFVGNGGSEGDHVEVAKHLVREIRDVYGFDNADDDDKEHSRDKRKEDVRNAEKELKKLFLRVGTEADKPLLIVLDAINQLADLDDAKQLNWLPEPPKNIRILFSTLESDVTMKIFRERQYPLFVLQPLGESQRRQLAVDYLASFGKRLTEAQITRIVTDTQCSNTLVLRTLLNELINFGVFERLDERIEYYLCSETIGEFYQTLLESYEVDYQDCGEGFVQRVLSLLLLSRSGLSEDEMLGILNAGSDVDAPRVSPLHWSQFYSAFRNHLTLKNGLITFGHSYVRAAVEQRYGHKNVEAIREEIIAYFTGQTTPRALHELPHQFYILNDNERLHDVLMRMDTFRHLYQRDKVALTRYWVRLQDNGYDIEDYLPLVNDSERPVSAHKLLADFCRTEIVRPRFAQELIERALQIVDNDKDKTDLLNLLTIFCALNADYERSLEIAKECLKMRIALRGELYFRTADAYSNVGYAYGKLGDVAKNLEYEQKALEIRKQLWGMLHSDVAKSYNNIACSYIALKDFDKALEYMQQALKIDNSLLGENHPDVALRYANIGVIYSYLGDEKKNLEYQLKALDIRLAVYGEHNSYTAYSYSNLADAYSDLNECAKAVEYKKKSAELLEKIFGEAHPDVANAYIGLGVMYGQMKDLESALMHQTRGLELLKKHFGGRLKKQAKTYTIMGNTCYRCDDYLKAAEYFLQAWKIYVDLYGKEHSDTEEVYSNLEVASWRLKGSSKMVDYCLMMLPALETVWGEDHTKVADMLRDLGEAYGKTGNSEKQAECFTKALNIYVTHFGEKSRKLAHMMLKMAVAYGDSGDNDAAAEWIKRAQETALALEDKDLEADCYMRLASLYEDGGDAPQALAYYKKALDISEAIGNRRCAMMCRRAIEHLKG